MQPSRLDDFPMPDDPSQTQTQTETELKFSVPPERLDALREALARGEVETLRLEAVYHDTVDDRLAAHAVALRVRREGDRWVQTAKALTPDALRRLEHNVEREAPADGTAPVFDLGLHDGTPVGAAIRAALAGTDRVGAGGPLVARFRTDVSRTTRVERHGGAVIELALDTGQVLAGAAASPVCEFELELKSGPVQALFELAETWALPHGLWLSTLTKAERGERLVRGVAHGEPLHAAEPVVDARAGPERFLKSVLDACLTQVLGNASEVAAGAADEEFVHQLRVGLRRLRTALRELGDLAEGVDPRWAASFASTFQALGVHRDAVEVGARLRDQLLAAGVIDAFTHPVPVAPTPPAETVREAAFQQAMLGVMAFCQHADAAPAPERRARRRLERRLAARLARLHDRLALDAQRFRALPAARQHRVRKRLKRLRYLAEFTAPLFGRRTVARFLDRWRAAQDALGQNNDLWVGLGWLQSSAIAGRERRRAFRWIAERTDRCTRRCDRRLRKALKQPVFWR